MKQEEKEKVGFPFLIPSFSLRVGSEVRQQQNLDGEALERSLYFADKEMEAYTRQKTSPKLYYRLGQSRIRTFVLLTLYDSQSARI